MSQFGPNGRGRPNRGLVRPGLLGASPSMGRGSLHDSLSNRPNPPQFLQDSQYEERFNNERQRRQGLLGTAPPEVLRQRENESSQFNRQSYHESREYSYENVDRYEDVPGRADFLNRLSPEVRQLMKNLGLSAGDMKELSKLPENELSSNNLARAIRDLRSRKLQENPQQHDLRNVIRSDQVIKEEFRHRSPTPEDLYDPAEPTEDHGQNHYDNDLYGNEHHPHQVEEAFSSFEQKWYSDQNPKQQSGDHQRDQPDASILRGSRGPAAKPPQRWPREEGQRPLPTTRKIPTRPMPEPRNHPEPRSHPEPRNHPEQRNHPGPRNHPQPSDHSEPHNHPEPRRSPVPLRREPPPMRPRLPRAGGLLGDPNDPSTEELDLLAATITGNRNAPPPQQYRENENNMNHHGFPPQQERFQEPPPAPAMIQAQNNMNPAPPSMLEAQMKAMQVLQSEALQQQQHGPPRGARESDRPPPGKTSYTKQEAQREAATMRAAQGRVLYIRFRCGPKNVVPENELARLAAPFDKVTNCLIVKPKNSRTSPGWYQAFLELEQFDGAAAMLEYYMIHTPSVRGISLQVQRSNYPNLKLREQMGQRNQLKRGRAYSISPERSRRRRSTDRRKSLDKHRRSPRSTSKDAGKEKSKKRDDDSKKPKLSSDKKKEETRRSQEKSKTKKRSPRKKEEDKKKVKNEDKKEKEEKEVQKVSKPKEKAESAKTPEVSRSTSTDGGYMLVDEIGEENDEKITEEKKKDQNENENQNAEKKEVEVKKEPSEEIKEEVNGAESDSGKESAPVVKEEENDDNDKVEEEGSNKTKLTYVKENLQQASNMAEALSKIVQQNSTQAIITDILDYLAKSMTVLEEVKLE